MLHPSHTSQLVQGDLHSVGSFMCDPHNPVRITPPSLGFRMLSPDAGTPLYAGQLIECDVRPVPGIRWRRVTEQTLFTPKKTRA